MAEHSVIGFFLRDKVFGLPANSMRLENRRQSGRLVYTSRKIMGVTTEFY